MKLAFENYRKEEAKLKYQSTGKQLKNEASNSNRSLLYEEIEMLREQVKEMQTSYSTATDRRNKEYESLL